MRHGAWASNPRRNQRRSRSDRRARAHVCEEGEEITTDLLVHIAADGDDRAVERDAGVRAARLAVRERRVGGDVRRDVGLARGGAADRSERDARLAAHRHLLDRRVGEAVDLHCVERRDHVRDLGADDRAERHADRADRARRRPRAVGQPRNDEARAHAQPADERNLAHREEQQPLRRHDDTTRRRRTR